MHRVTPVSSSSSSCALSSASVVSAVQAQGSTRHPRASHAGAPSIPLRLARPLDVPLTPLLWFSSSVSSVSSFFARLVRLELLEGGRGARCPFSFDLGAPSAVGDPAGDLLVEVDGPERRPERRGSLGEGGGPIEATLAIEASVEKTVWTREEMEAGQVKVRTTQGFLARIYACNPNRGLQNKTKRAISTPCLQREHRALVSEIGRAHV